jgi:serine/threonine-protein kinase
MRALQAALGDAFEIKQRLGRGSMAVVYLAKERELDRLVAVKVLHPGKAADETARRRFEREARAAAALAHPNVVQVFRFGRLPDETPYLVMRFVKGRTMEDRLRAEGQLPLDLARRVLTDVTAALAAAHAHGIVHRDVRPANILWDEESDSALLSDFGIAALLATSGEEVTRLTRTGQMVGDPRYLSPEQLKDEDLTELADMYSLGVLGYELYTGEGPYEARTNAQWITAHLNAEPRDLTAMRPGVDPAIAALLRRCLNRVPNHRPRAADASRVLRGEVVAPPGAAAAGGVEDAADLQELIRRRVPQIVIVAAAAMFGFLELVGLLVERGTLPQVAWELSLPFAASAVAASAVVAWFHGERGRQQTNVLEWMLLSVIGVVWLTVSGWIVLGPGG